MSDETEQNAGEQAPETPRKRKAAAKPKVEKQEAADVGTDDEEDVYVVPRSRARLARAERLARIGGEA